MKSRIFPVVKTEINKKKRKNDLFVLDVAFQLAKFRKLKADYGKKPGRMCDNNRPIQPLNDRTVYFVRRRRND